MEKRKNTLSALKTCRFCLCKDETLSSLYDRSRTPKNGVPLALQIMSCVSVEVFPSDRMPSQICERCRYFMDLCYNFKQICRKADESIMEYIQEEEPLEPVVWPSKLTKAFRLANPPPKKIKVEPGTQTSKQQMSQQQTTKRQQTSQQRLNTSASNDEEESEEDSDNVFNIKIGDGTDEDSTCIQVVKAGDKLTITKDNPKSKSTKATLPPYKAGKQALDRPFSCKFCSQTFIKKNHVLRHTRIKHKDMDLSTTGTDFDHNQYSCDQCEETFATQDELMYHSAKHATENLTCPLCHEKFEHVEEVSDHIKTHADGAEFMCELCELVFTSKIKLDLHVVATHDDEINPGQDAGADEESMEMDEEEDDDNDSNIRVKEEDDHMVVEIKKTDEFIIGNMNHASSQIKTEDDYFEAEDEEFRNTYTELTTVDTLALTKEVAKKQQTEKTPTILNKAGAKTPEKSVQKKGDPQGANILRKAEEIKRKAGQRTIEIISNVTLNPETKLAKNSAPKTVGPAATLTPVVKPATPTVKPASAAVTTPKTVAKPETATSGASDKSLRLLEKELQELKRTNNSSSNDPTKTPTKSLEVLRNRRPVVHSTPKPRQVKTPYVRNNPLAALLGLEVKESHRNRAVEEKKSIPKTPQVDKKQPDRRVITKENKEPKEKEATKTNNNNTSTKTTQLDETKEKESPKPPQVVKNGRTVSTEEAPRRSTRPSKVKDYAKMIRDNRVSSSDDTDDDDEEYKEEEEEEDDKPAESARSRRGRVVKTPAKAATAATPTADTPNSGVRKRGRPRKDKPQEVPTKIMKSTQEDEVNDEESKQTADQPEPQPSKESKQTDKPENENTEIKTAAEENKPSPTKTAVNPEVVKKLIVSPTGQTLKKVPINSLPPGVKPLPLPASSRPVNAGELCEMQIGKKTVKVHKIVMTKAEVEAMAKKGLVEMKDGTMVLKQGIKLPTNVKSTLVGEGEPSGKKEKGAPTRCSIGED